MRIVLALLLLAAMGLGVLWMMDSPPSANSDGDSMASAPPVLGPADGFELPPTEIERVAVGTVAPDFSLEAFSGDVVTLSDYRGSQNVVLVFYRGHW